MERNKLLPVVRQESREIITNHIRTVRHLHWQTQFRVGSELMLKGIRFIIDRVEEKRMILRPWRPSDRKRK